MRTPHLSFRLTTVSRDIVTLAADTHHGTWTTPKAVPHVPDITTLHTTTSGAKAADPLTNVTFNLVITRFITELHHKFARWAFAQPSTIMFRRPPTPRRPK